MIINRELINLCFFLHLSFFLPRSINIIAVLVEMIKSYSRLTCYHFLSRPIHMLFMPAHLDMMDTDFYSYHYEPMCDPSRLVMIHKDISIMQRLFCLF